MSVAVVEVVCTNPFCRAYGYAVEITVGGWDDYECPEDGCRRLRTCAYERDEECPSD